MADIGTLRAFITADNTSFIDGVRKSDNAMDGFAKRTQQRLEKTGLALSSLGKSMAIAITAPLAAASVGMLKLAADAEETASKFDVVFKDVAFAANKASDTLADSFGFADTEAKRLLATSGDLLAGFGFTGQAALDMAVQVNTLAADLASFSNIEGGSARASEALTKALLGETEQAKALGIVIRQDSDEFKNLVKFQMENEGLTLLQAKAVAALTIAQNQSKNAIGDFARTQDSLSNRMRIFKARLVDSSVEMGTRFIPLAQKMLTWANDMMDALDRLSPQTQRLAIVIGAVAAATGPALFIFGKLLTMGGGMIGMFTTMVPILLTVVGPILAIAAVLGVLWSAFGDVLGLKDLFARFWNFMVESAQSVANFFGEFGAFLRDENADISDSTRTAIEFISKAWLSLKIVWATVGNAMVGVVRVILDSISSFISGIEWLAEKVGVDLPEGVKSFQESLSLTVDSLEDVEKQNADTIASLVEQWDAAPAILREDVNQLVSAFEALPEGLTAMLEQAFPNAFAKVEEWVAKIKEFIATGFMPEREEGEDPFDIGLGDLGAQNDAALESTKKTTDGIKDMWMSVGRSYVSAFSQIAGALKKGSAAQKAFAITSIIMDTAIGIMKAFELPFPLNWAQAAAIGIMGAVQLSQVGGGSSGGSAPASGGTGQTAIGGANVITPAARESTIIRPDIEEVVAGEGGNEETRPAVFMFEGGAVELAGMVTQAVRELGAGDGSGATLAIEGG